MKSFKALYIVIALCFISPAIQAQQQDWVGSWEYRAPQADPPYQEGTIVFTSESDTVLAFIDINENRISARQVEVSPDSASFNVFIQGESIKVSLTKDAEKASGEATFSGQTIPVTAERVI